MEKRSPYLLSVSLAAILAWLSYWLITTRYAMLDDALIHLHYADLLHRYHFITFDGIRHGFGTSSLLYVSLLAVLRGFSTSPLLGKLVSDLSYLFLVGIVFGLVVKLRQHTSSQLLLAGLLFCLLSPMGIRWLTDGMETSLTNLLIVILAVITKTEQASYTQSKLRYLLLVVFGAILVYQRIELALIVALCCLSILLIKLSNKKSPVA